MKWILLLVLSIPDTDPSVSEINQLKKEAKEAYERGNFEQASRKYSYLADSLSVEEDEINLNLAHSYFQLDDTTNAQNAYNRLTDSSNPALKSIAYQQLGVMAKKKNDLQKSLQYLKSSLKSNPTNDEARYNYEVVKKLLENQQQQKNQNKDQKDQQNQENQQKDQNQKDQQNQEQQNQEQQKDQQQKEQDKEEQQQNEQQEGEQDEEDKNKQEQLQNTQKKLEEMNMSEEKAQMILEAMKNNEIQYIQQQRRKPTQRPDTGKPDW